MTEKEKNELKIELNARKIIIRKLNSVIGQLKQKVVQCAKQINKLAAENRSDLVIGGLLCSLL